MNLAYNLCMPCLKRWLFILYLLRKLPACGSIKRSGCQEANTVHADKGEEIDRHELIAYPSTVGLSFAD
jgi:hypothetical protein